MQPNPSRRSRRRSALIRVPALSLAGALLASVPAVGAAQEFSADVVFTPVSGKPDGATGRPAVPTVPSARLYVQKEQMRFESRGVTGQTLVVDDANQTTVALFPRNKTYEPLGSRPSEYFRVADAERACPDWQKAVGKEIDCKKVGSEVVEGRRSVKYSRHMAGGSAEYVWIDRKLNFVIKWRTDQIEAQLRNVQQGPQSAELFAVPQNYKIVTPRKSKARPLAR
jgi:hypothetical protein